MHAELTITLSLPPRELNPNVARRLHWGKKSRAANKYRLEAKVMALQAMREQWGRGEGSVRFRRALPFKKGKTKCTFFFPIKRDRDGDNLLASMKPAFDGLQDAGLIQDDKGLTHLPVEYWGQAGEQHDPRVEVFLELES